MHYNAFAWLSHSTIILKLNNNIERGIQVENNYNISYLTICREQRAWRKERGAQVEEQHDKPNEVSSAKPNPDEASGAQFLPVPANRKSVICAVICPEPVIAAEIRCFGWLFATMKQSRWPAKIVTNLLTLALTLLPVGFYLFFQQRFNLLQKVLNRSKERHSLFFIKIKEVPIITFVP